MDDGNPPSLIVITSLILFHGLLALAYGALTNMRVSTLRDQADEGQHRAARVLHMVHENANFSITHNLVTTLLKFVIAALAIQGLVQPYLALNPEAGAAVYVAVLLTVILATVIFGETVPESIGSAHPNGIGFFLVDFYAALMTLFSPAVWLVLLASRALSSLFTSSQMVNRLTEEEIVTMIESGHTGGTLEEEEKDMILSVLQLDRTRVSEVMVPRIDIVALDIDTSLEAARARFIETGLSRIPVYEGTVDAIKGLLYAKDLLSLWHSGDLSKPADLRELMRPVYFVPEAKPVDELLKELQHRRVHMAIVVDEYGGTAGLVTIENVIEEIIGDIQDEYDKDEEAEYVRLSPREYRVDASIDLDDFNDLLDVELPTEDSNTLGGFIYTHFGRIPSPGEEFTHDNLRLRVETVEGRRIRKVYVQLPDDTPKADDDAADDGQDAPVTASAPTSGASEDDGHLAPQSASAMLSRFASGVRLFGFRRMQSEAG